MIRHGDLINDRFTHAEYFGDFAVVGELCKCGTGLWPIQGFFHTAHIDIFHAIILDFGKRFGGIHVGIPALHCGLTRTKDCAHISHTALLGLVPRPANQRRQAGIIGNPGIPTIGFGVCFEQNRHTTHVIADPVNPGHIFTEIKIRAVFAPSRIGRVHKRFTIQRQGDSSVITITQTRRCSSGWVDKCSSDQHRRHHLPPHFEGGEIFAQQLPDPCQNHRTTNRPKHPHLHAKLKDAVHAPNITLGH